MARLDENEVNIYRSYVGTFMWLSLKVRPDLAFSVLEICKKVLQATIKDMKAINAIVRKVSRQGNIIKYMDEDTKEHIKVIAISDLAYFRNNNYIIRSVITLASDRNNRTCPLEWKNVCRPNLHISQPLQLFILLVDWKLG